MSCCGASAGTAAWSEQRAKPSSASVTTSASASTTRFAPVIPRSTTPSCAYSGMSLGRTSSRSTGALAHGTTSERSVTSNESPASAQSRRAGSAMRPFAGTARVSLPFSPARVNAAVISASALGAASDRERSGSRPYRGAATARPGSPWQWKSRTRSAISTYGTPCSSSNTICHRCASASSSGRVHRSRRKHVTSSGPRRDVSASASSRKPGTCSTTRSAAGSAVDADDLARTIQACYHANVLTRKLEDIPAIDVLEGRVVRLSQGRREAVTIEGGGSRRGRARLRRGRRDTGCISSTSDGAFSGAPSLDLLTRVCDAGGLPLQVAGRLPDARGGSRRPGCGGGSRDGRDGGPLPGFVEAAVARFGDALVVAVDVRDGRVAVDG